jgi:hypothetical protein
VTAPPVLGWMGGPLLGVVGHPVVMVGTDMGEVERRLRAGDLVTVTESGSIGHLDAKKGHGRSDPPHRQFRMLHVVWIPRSLLFAQVRGGITGMGAEARRNLWRTAGRAG